MKKISKFDYELFYNDYNESRFFAVSKQKYTKEEARVLFEQETDCAALVCQTQDGAVIWRAGVMDNEPCVGWWLHLDRDGTEPRHCPVWVFEY